MAFGRIQVGFRGSRRRSTPVLVKIPPPAVQTRASTKTQRAAVAGEAGKTAGEAARVEQPSCGSV